MPVFIQFEIFGLIRLANTDYLQWIFSGFFFFHTRFVSNHNHDDNEYKHTFDFPRLFQTLYRLLFFFISCINTNHHYMCNRHICWYKIHTHTHTYIYTFRYLYILYILKSSSKSNTYSARVESDLAHSTTNQKIELPFHPESSWNDDNRLKVL